MDKSNSRLKPSAVAGIVLLLALLVAYPWLVTGPYPRHVMILVLMYIVLGQAWNILGGYSGQISLGNHIFFALGAYTSTMLLMKTGLPPWLGVVPGMALAALAALAVGQICFDLRGHYFAIATLGLAEITYILFLNWDFVNRAFGFQIPMVKDSAYYVQWTSKAPYYYIMLAIAVAVVAFVWKMDHARFGVYLKAIREDEERAKSLGIDSRRYKLMAFVVSAAITALVGTFYAQYVLYIDPDSLLNLEFGLLIIIIPMVGGMGNVLGPILGACLLVPMAEYTRITFGGGGRGLHVLLYGLVIVLVALYEPHGLIGIYRSLRGSRLGRSVPADAPAVEEGQAP
ncbi:MAG TPA: branched-chain amino acid ABC transporter permease [Candidatus Sulfotelmatobacter sp.]|nr:branched-chain amino acid ABC transporter permease [Candidatus Sulfotelmatobacter sp.]